MRAPIQDAITIEGLLLDQKCRQRSDPPYGVKVKDRTEERKGGFRGRERQQRYGETEVLFDRPSEPVAIGRDNRVCAEQI